MRAAGCRKYFRLANSGNRPRSGDRRIGAYIGFMRSYPLGTLSGTAAGLLILSGCSPDNESPPASAPPPSAGGTTVSAAPVAPGEFAVSPNGVTTAVGAPAESTEDDYFQACRAAKTWMDAQGGDPGTQIEPYLATVQGTESAGPGTFGRPWRELSPGQQSAVIVAVQAAVDGLCE